MKKYTPPPHIVVAILAVCGIGYYGMTAWYFVGPDTWLLAIPIGVVGLVLGVRMWQGVRHLYAEKHRRSGPFVSALLAACFMIMAFGRGAPALAMRLMGPDAQIAATVFRKKGGSRLCRRQIYLAEYWPSRLCVDERQYDAVEQGERVLLNARTNALGTLIFSIESKDARS